VISNSKKPWILDLQRFSPGQALPFTSGGRRCSESFLAVTRENMENEENSFDLLPGVAEETSQ
jgi:hypothetical protein